MAQIQKMRFATEVAPPRIISVAKHPLVKILDTIDEDKAYASVLSSSLKDLLDPERFRRQISLFE